MDGGGAPGRHFDPRNVHDPMQTKILNCQNLDELTNLILLDQFEFNLVHCSTAFNKFGTFRKDKQKLLPREQGALKALLEMAKDKQFLPRQSSNIIRAIAVGALGEENPQAISLLETLIDQENFQQWKPMEIAHVVEALSLLQLKHEVFFSKMGKELSSRNLNNFNAQDITSLLTSYAQLQLSSASEVFDAFAREMQSRDLKQDLKDKRRSDLDTVLFTLQRLVTILCAYAQVSHRMELPLLEKITHEIATRPLKHLKPSEVANLAWALTVLGYQPKTVFDKLIPEVDMKRGKYTYHHLATIAWAFATVKLDFEQKRKLYDIIAKELKNRKEREATIESLVNVVWAFAKVGFITQMLFVRIANEVSQNRNLDEFLPDQLAHLVWGFAYTHFRHTSLYDKVAQHLLSRSLQQFRPYDLAKLTWGLGVSRTRNIKTALASLEQELFGRGLGSFSTGQLTEFLRGLAEAEDNIRLSSDMYNTVAQEVASKSLNSFKPTEISNLLYAYGKFGWNNSELFETVGDLLVSQSLENFSVGDLASVAFGYASLQFYHRALFDRIASSFANRTLHALHTSISDVILLCWSLACNQHLTSSYAAALFNVKLPSFNSVPQTERTARNAVFLSQCVVAWKQIHEGDSLPSLLEQLRFDGWVEQTIPQNQGDIVTQASSVSKEISKSLQEMGFVHLIEDYKMADGVTAAVRVSSNVVVEVVDLGEGLLCDRKSVSGDAAFKCRLLENAGFWVATVHAPAWTALSNNADEEKLSAAREKFLNEKLQSLA